MHCLPASDSPWERTDIQAHANIHKHLLCRMSLALKIVDLEINLVFLTGMILSLLSACAWQISLTNQNRQKKISDLEQWSWFFLPFYFLPFSFLFRWGWTPWRGDFATPSKAMIGHVHLPRHVKRQAYLRQLRPSKFSQTNWSNGTEVRSPTEEVKEDPSHINSCEKLARERAYDLHKKGVSKVES